MNKSVLHTDEEILALLRATTTANKGFELLMNDYQERLYWHIRRMVLDHDDANDVLQNTFIKVFKGHHNFKGQSKLFTWLYRIATNETMTFLKKRKKHQSESNDEQMAMLKADPFFDAEGIQEKLLRAIVSLPDKQKAVFQLRYYNEMSYQDMSEVLGTSEGALKASYHHAVKKIELFFNEKE